MFAAFDYATTTVHYTAAIPAHKKHGEYVGFPVNPVLADVSLPHGSREKSTCGMRAQVCMTLLYTQMVFRSTVGRQWYTTSRTRRLS